MKSKAARGFPSTTCQGHFSLQSTLETRLSRDARKSSRTTHSPDILFFLPVLSEERESTIMAKSFLLLYWFELMAQNFWLGVRLVRKRAKFFTHKCENCKRLILVVRFLKIGCHAGTFLKYLPRLSLCYEISVSPV